MPAPDTDNPYFVGPPPMTGSIAPDTDYPFFVGPPDFWFALGVTVVPGPAWNTWNSPFNLSN